ncbi:MAG: hypothetical protein EPO11_02205 [Gammaproteobacteria bacterium]|nr:MAG: hypothetical protein EPO11_02205 [Gammaproteobacteria bacterium]
MPETQVERERENQAERQKRSYIQEMYRQRWVNEIRAKKAASNLDMPIPLYRKLDEDPTKKAKDTTTISADDKFQDKLEPGWYEISNIFYNEGETVKFIVSKDEHSPSGLSITMLQEADPQWEPKKYETLERSKIRARAATGEIPQEIDFPNAGKQLELLRLSTIEKVLNCYEKEGIPCFIKGDPLGAARPDDSNTVKRLRMALSSGSASDRKKANKLITRLMDLKKQQEISPHHYHQSNMNSTVNELETTSKNLTTALGESTKDEDKIKNEMDALTAHMDRMKQALKDIDSDVKKAPDDAAKMEYKNMVDDAHSSLEKMNDLMKQDGTLAAYTSAAGADPAANHAMKNDVSKMQREYRSLLKETENLKEKITKMVNPDVHAANQFKDKYEKAVKKLEDVVKLDNPATHVDELKQAITDIHQLVKEVNKEAQTDLSLEALEKYEDSKLGDIPLVLQTMRKGIEDKVTDEGVKDQIKDIFVPAIKEAHEAYNKIETNLEDKKQSQNVPAPSSLKKT